MDFALSFKIARIKIYFSGFNDVNDKQTINLLFSNTINDDIFSVKSGNGFFFFRMKQQYSIFGAC